MFSFFIYQKFVVSVDGYVYFENHDHDPKFFWCVKMSRDKRGNGKLIYRKKDV